MPRLGLMKKTTLLCLRTEYLTLFVFRLDLAKIINYFKPNYPFVRPSKLTCLCGPRARYSYKRYYLGETRRRAASLDAGIRRLHSHVGGAARPPRYHRKEAPVYPTPPQHTNICFSCQDWICFVLFWGFFLLSKWRRVVAAEDKAGLNVGP